MRKKILCLSLTLLFLLTWAGTALAAKTDLTPLFEEARAALKTPGEEALETGVLELRTGDTVWLPFLTVQVIPFDEQDETPVPAPEGAVEIEDESVVSVSPEGRLTALGEGETLVVYRGAQEQSLRVVVRDDAMPWLARSYVYVLNREFTEVQRARLPKYNKYAKWYYGKRKEVGWCSVFTIYCANAAGAEPVKEQDLQPDDPPRVLFLREGQVGNQYDGFQKTGRFVGVPRPGYLAIYADLSNAYLTTHIGSVTAVEDRGNGVYAVTTVEGNMSNSVKSYTYLYDSRADNSQLDKDTRNQLRENMSELPEEERTDPLVQYTLHTDHWAVFGFCQTW